jgi:energy-coupling factor transport system substrate-specific component
MSEERIIDSGKGSDRSMREKLRNHDTHAIVLTLLAALVGAGIYLITEVIPMPYIAVGLFPLGLAPALAVVAVVGAIRGPIAGFLTGYIGELIVDIFLTGGILTFTLYGVAFGALGLISGLPSYDFTSGRSLAKLSTLSVIGLVFTALITAMIGLFVEHVASLVAIGFQLLPILTIGLPTVILLTPLFAYFWNIVSVKIPLYW